MSEEKFAVPKGLGRFANKLHEAMIEEEEAAERQRQEEIWRRKEVRMRNREAGLQYAQAIFTWALQFRSSETGKKLIQVGHPLVSYARENGVFFFDGDVVGKAWRGLGVDNGGVWWKANGCGCHPMSVSSPEELAEQVDAAILACACTWIQDGRVWKCIKDCFAD
ncbi:MAG: hypothetical protein G01um101448_1088 [Parcubacteria group bacterium Gr01-1014_48]|nr:MAG: hypothetical protein Greene041614_451 [Parcubacteria group bacterium Greene0416_14]TSC71801.1 MAG: hypothetical protein G01um101448_1088 [Parcubacteria group bacterium Gr01-1014_48]TSD00985.1 MAG: hypothetical protein Greene101415_558 [Parcubacteria group bacterium Greene1014_15]TSD08119.1 MAG: hypothetical protein Greene07144_403 [Parcubacteria group bacterium Greene0714_4]